MFCCCHYYDLGSQIVFQGGRLSTDGSYRTRTTSNSDKGCYSDTNSTTDNGLGQLALDADVVLDVSCGIYLHCFVANIALLRDTRCLSKLEETLVRLLWPVPIVNSRLWKLKLPRLGRGGKSVRNRPMPIKKPLRYRRITGMPSSERHRTMLKPCIPNSWTGPTPCKECMSLGWLVNQTSTHFFNQVCQLYHITGFRSCQALRRCRTDSRTSRGKVRRFTMCEQRWCHQPSAISCTHRVLNTS